MCKMQSSPARSALNLLKYLLSLRYKKKKRKKKDANVQKRRLASYTVNRVCVFEAKINSIGMCLARSPLELSDLSSVFVVLQ